ncbi:hypothetical protein VIGAN_04004700 [Vigna angularis var. angularis]|uniref:Uncharacterized protein n=1 Tax=Vigna angularis var. angularis TaxID=157739 RepID=A0A0S3RQT5_PHAAN|nr:hypothetical protein VIGAN_04004700 [Vigna angularis var. angularis]
MPIILFEPYIEFLLHLPCFCKQNAISSILYTPRSSYPHPPPNGISPFVQFYLVKVFKVCFYLVMVCIVCTTQVSHICYVSYDQLWIGRTI